MRSAEIYRNTLRAAVRIAGSELSVARHLGVALPQLKSWLEGVEDVPESAFLGAADIVIDRNLIPSSGMQASAQS